jgi:hypothetical protein
MNESAGTSPVSNDTVAALSFDFLKQLTTLSLASAGGAITLLQVAISAPKAKYLAYVATGLLFLAAVLALQAQQILVERLKAPTSAQGDASFRKLKFERTARTQARMTMGSFLMFGAGVALLVLSLLAS